MSKGTYSDKIKSSHFNSLYIRVNIHYRKIDIWMVFEQLCHFWRQNLARLTPLGVEVHYNCMIRIDDLERMQCCKYNSQFRNFKVRHLFVEVKVIFDDEALGTAC